MKSICFISLKSYDLIRGSSELRYVGGAERQQVLVGQGLRDLGYKVSFITLDYGQPDGIEHNGIRVFKAYDINRGLPGLRFFYPRWHGLWSAMRRANADIYHQMGADTETGQIALWCRHHKRRFVFAVAADLNCQRNLPYLKRTYERWLCRFGIQNADLIVTQTFAQKKALTDNFGIASTVIPSCASLCNHHPSPVQKPRTCGQITILWVGRIVPVKRLELLLDLAERCPRYQFQIVGSGNEADPYVRALLERSRQLFNVEFLGRVPDHKLWDLYERAHVFLDTALSAGVPTTFLEAWARGVPVVSTVNPDGVITANNLGRTVTTVADMEQAIAELATNPKTWLECSLAARRYYEQHHTVEAVSRAYHHLLANL